MSPVSGRVTRHLPLTFVMILAAVLLLAAACDDGEPDITTSITSAGSDAPRSRANPGAGEQAAAATRAFAADLYRELAATEDGNLVFSPHSIAIALAMTRAGAEGETASQMDAVLHASRAGDLHAGFNALEQALAGRSGEYPIGGGDETAELELSIVNQLWGQEGFEFVDDFLDLLAAEYGADMRLVDFVQAYEEARVLINEWVAERTRERIDELIPEGVIDDMTRLVLTNAIYLNAPWVHRFDEDATAPAAFTLLDGNEVEVDMMRLDERIEYGEGDGFQAVRLPYVDGSLSMIAVLPDDFAAFESGLDGDRVDEIVASLGDARVELGFPRFEFRTEALLKDALSNLGMPIAFEPDEADFSGIAPPDDLHIQDVVHEGFISVDEHGTEAAAATAVVVGVVSAPPINVEVDFDRPFLFFVHDRDSGAILFMGRVLNPVS